MEIQKIFLSYSRIDSEFALKLAISLRNEGINIWFDQMDIRSGTHFDTEIQKAIQSAKCVLVILSPNSVSSNNVLDEASYALDEGKQVIPIVLVDCAVPLRLRRLQYIDFRTNFSLGLKLLLDELNSKEGKGVKAENLNISDTLITKKGNYKKLLFTSLIFFGLVLITIIVFFVTGPTINNSKNASTSLKNSNREIVSDSTADDSNKNDSASLTKKRQKNNVALFRKKSSKDESKSITDNKKIRSVIITKPIEADNTIPEIISWKIYDKNSKKAYTLRTDHAPVTVNADADLEISCTIQDPQGVKKVDIFGNASWECNKTGSMSFSNHQISGQLWDYTRSDNKVYSEVTTVLAINIEDLHVNPCTEADSSLNSKTGRISIFCSAYNYSDVPKVEELKFQFIRNKIH